MAESMHWGKRDNWGREQRPGEAGALFPDRFEVSISRSIFTSVEMEYI